MSVNNEETREDYTLNGVTTSYDYGFKIFEDTDLEVTKLDLAGLETTLTLNTDYTVTGAGTETGGTVELDDPGTSGEHLTIRRDLPKTQTISFRNQGSFYPERHEDAFDKVTMLIQQVTEEASRSILLPVSFAGDTTIGNLIPGYALGINSTGTGVECVANTGADQSADLSNATSGVLGSALIGWGAGLAYPSGSVGGKINALYETVTTTGTAPSFAAAPSTPWTSLDAGKLIRIRWHAAGTAPTVSISGTTACNVKHRTTKGAKITAPVFANLESLCMHDGTDLVIMNHPLSTQDGPTLNFAATCGGTSTNSAVTITCDNITLRDSSGNAIELTSVSQSLLMASSGAGGLDTGSVATGTEYSMYIIYNILTSTTAALASLSATSPTLPSGYTFFKRVGGLITDGTSGYPLSGKWKNNEFSYVVAAASNVTASITIATGAKGTASTSAPTYVTASIIGKCITHARAIKMSVTNAYKWGTWSTICLAPNTSYGGIGSSSGNAPLLYIPLDTVFVQNLQMELESTNIAIVSSGTGGAFFCTGWIDTI